MLGVLSEVSLPVLAWKILRQCCFLVLHANYTEIETHSLIQMKIPGVLSHFLSRWKSGMVCTFKGLALLLTHERITKPAAG